MTGDRRTCARTNRHNRRRAAFSLIEVLLGVLILALGLLGLAAVIPAVVAQQRNAANVTLGVSAANSAIAYLSNRPDLNRVGSLAAPRGLGVWLFDDGWSREFQWEAPVEVDPGTGTFTLGSGTDAVVIHVRDRLWPGPSSGRAAPAFVWDIVARRVPGTWEGATYTPPPPPEPEIEFIVFVRRVDSGIRAGDDETIWEVLDPSLPGSLCPVAVDESSGLPTFNGIGDYSAPVRMQVRFAPAPDVRNQLELTNVMTAGIGGNSELMRNLAARAGQKLVDNFGNIYTVVGPHPDAATNPDSIIIDPSVPAWVDPAALTQVVFTPQIPAYVEVFRLPAVNP